MTSRSLAALGIAASFVAALIVASLLIGGLTSAKAEAGTTLTPAHRSSSPVQLTAGSVEFSPTVSFTHQNFKREGYGNVEHFTQLDMRPTIGFCVTDHYEVMAGILARHQSVNGDKDTALGATAGLTYNFSRHGNIIPFATLAFGALFYDGFTMDRTAVLLPMLSGGVRVPVGSKAAVNLSLGYQHESNADGEFNASANRMLASVGVSLFPWRTK
jgi:hypothetical protein